MTRQQKYHTLFLFVAAGWLAPLTTGAQPIAGLLVTGSDPANGAVTVPTQSQVTFTFSAPIDGSAVYSSGLPINLLDPNGDIAARISSYTLSPDERSLTLNITNPADADVALVVTAARSADGDDLCNPYALNYSTRHDAGAFSVSGWAYWALTKTGVYDCSPGDPVVVATLFDTLPEQGGTIQYAGISQDHYYLIGRVRPGTYWPYYFFDMNGDGDIVPTITSINHPYNEVVFYDTDFDQVVESITVTSDDLTDISPFLYYPQASEKYLLPKTIILDAVFPNPFSETLTSRFSLNVPGPVEMTIFDAIGRRQYSIQLGVLPVGNHTLRLETPILPGGQYYVELRSMSTRHVQSVVHIRR